MRIIHGLGRAIFGGFFLYNGINHLRNAEALEGYAAAKQVDNPHLSVKGSGILLTAAGAAIALGLAPRLGALGVTACDAGQWEWRCLRAGLSGNRLTPRLRGHDNRTCTPSPDQLLPRQAARARRA